MYIWRKVAPVQRVVTPGSGDDVVFLIVHLAMASL